MKTASIIWTSSITALVTLTICASDAGAYPSYSQNRDATNCRACHGDFRATSYISLSDGQNWGNLHNLHRTTMLSGDCDTCHGASTFPVVLDSSAGGAGFQAIACMGCHGRNEDMGHDSVSMGRGAGLRQHHFTAGVTLCAGCHADANPVNYTPVGENVSPPYYFTPDANHPDKPTNPCNPNGEENYAGAAQGLDNDGDNAYDRAADGDCAPVPGDLDGDGNVDLNDYSLFAGCMNGPNVTAPPPGCDPVDFSGSDLDVDGDVDLEDGADFVVVFTG